MKSKREGVESDIDLTADDLKDIIEASKASTKSTWEKISHKIQELN